MSDQDLRLRAAVEAAPPPRRRWVVPNLQLVSIRPSTPRKRAASTSPMAIAIEVILRRVARSGEALPNNPRLGDMAGKCRQSVKKALERLTASGNIVIDYDRKQALRRIRFADGARTAWGDARPGHAPYCARPRGSAPLPKVRALESKPLPAVLPPGPVVPPVITAPALRCQWPMWADNERANGCYCDAPSQAGRSWCVEHTHLVHGAPLGPAKGFELQAAGPLRLRLVGRRS